MAAADEVGCVVTGRSPPLAPIAWLLLIMRQRVARPTTSSTTTHASSCVRRRLARRATVTTPASVTFFVFKRMPGLTPSPHRSKPCYTLFRPEGLRYCAASQGSSAAEGHQSRSLQ
jgi:hypothetical protein